MGNNTTVRFGLETSKRTAGNGGTKDPFMPTVWAQIRSNEKYHPWNVF